MYNTVFLNIIAELGKNTTIDELVEVLEEQVKNKAPRNVV